MLQQQKQMVEEMRLLRAEFSHYREENEAAHSDLRSDFNQLRSDILRALVDRPAADSEALLRLPE